MRTQNFQNGLSITKTCTSLRLNQIVHVMVMLSYINNCFYLIVFEVIILGLLYIGCKNSQLRRVNKLYRKNVALVLVVPCSQWF